jgi:Flp pilus assembly pilin Flp
LGSRSLRTRADADWLLLWWAIPTERRMALRNAKGHPGCDVCNKRFVMTFLPYGLRSIAMKSLIKRFFADEKAAEVTELGIVLALIVAGAVATIALIGPKIQSAYDTVNTAIPASGGS